MRVLIAIATLPLLTSLPLAAAANSDAPEASSRCAPQLDQHVRRLNSDEMIDLCALTAGKTTLVVNTASRCGYTGQFDGLEALHQRYKDKGLVVVGFPSGDFRQEASNESDTAQVCFVNYGVTFTVAATDSVRGDSAQPVFAALRQQAPEPSWNFNKYLISADGESVTHFSPNVAPLASPLEAAVKQALAL